MVRERQLLGKWEQNHSFFIRPIQLNPKNITADSFFQVIGGPKRINNKWAQSFSFHPLKNESLFNSDRPYGWNNGTMLQSRGLNTRTSIGANFRKGIFEINFQPEWVFANNAQYDTTRLYGMSTGRKYSKYFAGQSYANINLAKFKIGYSNQNLWWGPGQFSSLLMSNNAPGFGHFHFTSKEPVHTSLIDLEWQLIGGLVKHDSLLSAENQSLKKGFYTVKKRYLNAVVLSLKPNFIKGLQLGFVRSLLVYDTWFKNKSVVAQFFKGKIYTQADAVDKNDGKDQTASVFMRLVMPKSHFEFYFEYGYNDFKANLRDLAIDAQHSSAYIVGFKKVFNAHENRYKVLSGELTQVAQSPNFVVRDGADWYTHYVLDGLTNMNQIMGAGSGLGNNVQTLQFESVSGSGRLGFKFQRIQNDPRKRTLDVNNIWIVPLQWTDITYGPVFYHCWKKIDIAGELQFVHSKNYGWSAQRKFNLFTALTLSYKW
jgi:hypothetical protein